jgi:hypothetical protein
MPSLTCIASSFADETYLSANRCKCTLPAPAGKRRPECFDI